MKKLVTILSLFATAAVFAETITVDYDFDAPGIESSADGTMLTIPKCGQYFEDLGAPVVPVYTARILLPDNASVRGVSAAVKESAEIVLDKPLAVAQTPAGVPAVRPREVFANGAYPANRAEFVEIERYHSWKIAVVRIYPVVMESAQKGVSSTKLTLSLDYDPTDSYVPTRKRRDDKRKFVLDYVDNPEAMPKSATPKMLPSPLDERNASKTYDWLLVCSSRFSDAFAPLVAFRQAQGLRTYTITTEYIWDHYTGDDMGVRIRHAIMDLYDRYGITYVLLGGDVDTIPHRYIAADSSKGIPCDMYYGCLSDRDDMNGNHNQVVGETTDGDGGKTDIDHTYEVFVGRAPVETVADVDIFVRKTIAHENDLDNSLSALYIGEYMGNGESAFGGNFLDDIENMLRPIGYASSWLDDRPFKSAGTQFGSEEVLEMINGRSPAVIVGMGHGVLNGIMRIDSSHVPLLRNSRPFFATSTACSAGGFAADHGATCIAEELIRGTRLADGGKPITNECYGAWGVVFNAGSGWYNKTHESAYSGVVYSEMMRQATENRHSIGKALALARQNEWSTSYYYRYAVLDPNLLGDPACFLIADDLSVENFEFMEKSYDSSTSTYPNKAATLRNRGSSSLAWSVETPAWITANTASGNLNAGSTASVTFTLNSAAKNLPCGLNIGEIKFRSPHNTIVRQARIRVYNSTIASVEITPPEGTILAESTANWTVAAKTSGNATATKYNGQVSLFVGATGTFGVDMSNTESFNMGSNSSTTKYFNHRFLVHRSYMCERNQSPVRAILTSVQFNIKSGPSVSNGKIRMRRFRRQAYYLNDYEKMDDNCWTTVYTGTIPFNTAGWVKVDLTTPFYFDPEAGENLEIEISGQASSTITYSGCMSETYPCAIYTVSGSAITPSDSLTTGIKNRRYLPGLQFDVVKVKGNVQSGQLTSGTGTIAFSAMTGENSKVYAMDGEAYRGEVTASFKDWGLVWTDTPSGDVDLGTPQRVTIQAQDSSGTKLTAISGTCNITPADPSGANDLMLQFDSEAFSTWQNVDIDTGDGAKAKRSTFVYTFSEVGGAGTLGAISIYVGQSSGGSITIPNFTVRMKDAMPAGNENGQSVFYKTDMNASGWTECYRGPLTLDGTGWVRIPFSTPFVYRGEHQLLVDISYWWNSGTVDSGNFKRLAKSFNNLQHNDKKRVINAADSDGSHGDPRNWNGNDDGLNGTVTSYRIWMRFHKSAANFCSAVPPSFQLVDGEWTGDITPVTLGNNLVFCADLNGGHHGCSGVINVREKATGAASNIDYRSFDIGYTVDSSFAGGDAYVVYSKKADFSSAMTNSIANVAASGSVSISGLDFASTYYVRVIVVKNGVETFSGTVVVNTRDPMGTVELSPVAYEVGEFGKSCEFTSGISRLVAGADEAKVCVYISEQGGEYELVSTVEGLTNGSPVIASVATDPNKVYLYRIVAESEFLGQKWYSVREGVFETEFIVENSWFNVDFETYNQGNDWMTTVDSSGTWTRGLDDEDAVSKVVSLSSEYAGRGRSLVQPGDASYARYTATAAEPEDAGNRVNFRTKMYMKAGTEPPSSVTEDLLTNCIASIYLKVSDDGSSTNYCGYVTSDGNSWVELHADGLAISDCAFHDVQIDVDYAYDTPKVRFRVDGFTLIDDNSTVWFDRANAGLGAGTAKLSSVAYLGNTKVDDFSAKIAMPDEGEEVIPDGSVASTGKGADRAYYTSIESAFAASAVNGQPVRLLADAAWNLNAGQSVSVQANGYNFTITMSAGDNYYLKTVEQGQVIVYTAQEKAHYDLSGITFADKTVEWTGNPQSIEIIGSLPKGVTVSYTGNGQTSIGTYTITANFTGDTTAHYPIPPMSATLTITNVRAGRMTAPVASCEQVDDQLVAKMHVYVTALNVNPATLTLKLNGNIVKTWTVTETGKYEWQAVVRKGTTYKARFTLSGGEATPVTYSSSTFKGSLKRKWIDVDAGSYTAPIANGYIDPVDLGTWTTNGFYRYTAKTPSRVKCDAYVLTRVQFPAANTKEVPDLPAGAQTAVCVFPEYQSFSYRAWNGSEWIKLTGLTPNPGSWCDVKIEFAYAEDCTRLARVSIGYRTLKVDGTTEEWFPIDGTARKLSSVGFFGGAAIGDFEGWYNDGFNPMGGTIIMLRDANYTPPVEEPDDAVDPDPEPDSPDDPDAGLPSPLKLALPWNVQVMTPQDIVIQYDGYDHVANNPTDSDVTYLNTLASSILGGAFSVTGKGVTVSGHAIQPQGQMSFKDSKGHNEMSGSGNSGWQMRPVFHIYVHLDTPLQDNVENTLVLPDNTEQTFVYHADDPLPIFKVNQVGYLASAAEKYVYLGGWLGTGGPLQLADSYEYTVVNKTTGQIVSGGTFINRVTTDPERNGVKFAGEKTLEADISDIVNEGVYYVQVAGLGRSMDFRVNDSAAADQFAVHMNGLYMHRCGCAKEEPYTHFTDACCHSTVHIGVHSPNDDEYSKRFTDENGDVVGGLNGFAIIRANRDDCTQEISLTGGWHDAADYDRRPYHMQTVCDLAMLYLMKPANFTDGQLAIPEHSNNIPDILDEADWGLKYLLAIQDPVTGGVGGWTESWTHPDYGNKKMPSGDTDVLTYYVGIPTHRTSLKYAGTAALLARALYQANTPASIARADIYKESAIKAFNYAMRKDNYHNRVQMKGPNNTTVYYTEPTWFDPLEYARAVINVGELTNDPAVFAHLGDKFVYNRGGKDDYNYGSDEKFLSDFFLSGPITTFDESFGRSAYCFNEIGLPSTNETYYSSIKALWRVCVVNNAEELLSEMNNTMAYRIPWWDAANGKHVEQMVWGSVCPLGRAMWLCSAHFLTGEAKYLKGAQLACDYQSGCNPKGATWTSGLGTVYPVKFLNLHSFADNIDEYIYGVTPFYNTYASFEYLPVRGNAMYANYSAELAAKPIFRRFETAENMTVKISEYTINQTIMPGAATTGYLIDSDHTSANIHWRQPASDIRNLPGYWALP